MQSIPSYSRRMAAALALALAAGGAFSGPVRAAKDLEPASCELRVSRQGGAITLIALAHAEEDVSGSYTLRVSGSGTNIHQGGPFEADAGRTATLGTATLSANGAGFRADLDVIVDGETLSCSRRIGGGI